MRPYAERRQARIELLTNRAQKARGEAEARLASAHRLAERIPMGQPILVGHHSEGRHRRDIKRIHDNMDKGVARLREAETLEQKAVAAAENDAISSDDPNAIPRLTAKLAGLEATRERWKQLNSAARRGRKKKPGTLLPEDEAALKPTDREKLCIVMSGGPCGFMIANLGGEIRRVEDRIKLLTDRASRPATQEETVGEVRVVRNNAENRVQMFFPGKPSDAVRKQLRSNGFQWAASTGAWQRKESNAAWYWAMEIAKGAIT